MLVYIVRPVYFIGDLLIARLCVDVLRHRAHVLQVGAGRVSRTLC